MSCVIPGKSLAAQHRLLVIDFNVTLKKKVAEKRRPLIKWWLRNGPMQNDFLAEVKSQNFLTITDTPQDAWDRAQLGIIAAGKRVLSVSKRGRAIDKETMIM